MLIALLAAATCLPCHESIVRAFARTPMANSVSRPVVEKRAKQLGRFRGQEWEAAWAGGGLRHRVDRESVAVEWSVGSGNEGKSYLFRRGDALFQSPLAWYSRRAAWDLSPGYGSGASIDFLRPVTADCLFCHAGGSAPVAGSLNRYAGGTIPQPGIVCGRCHGEAKAHAKEPRRGNIVNPKRLAARARDSVCEQCHLAGTARILLPGKRWSDFRPGLELEQVFSVYVPAGKQAFKVVSHAEQLALSRCAQASGGQLWCGSCNDVHKPKVERAAASASCAGCHAGTKKHGEACAECHMPRTKAFDGGHTAFTDHRIQVPGKAPAVAETAAVLRAWREPAGPFRGRGLGLAYAGAGMMDRALPLLREAGRDAEVMSALGLAALRGGKAAEAVAAFAGAAKAEPNHSVRALNLAAALSNAGQRDRAREAALRAIALEPLLLDAYALLAELEPERAAYWRGRFEAEWEK